MRAVILASVLALGCSRSVNACVSTYTDRSGVGTVTACRQDADDSTCGRERASTFTRGRSCADVGYPCLHDAFDAVLSEARDPSGACPSGTSAVR